MTSEIAAAIRFNIDPLGAHSADGVVRAEMDARQDEHFAWAKRVFGDLPGVDVMSPRVRALRFLEEAIELYQAVTIADGMTPDAAETKAAGLLDYVFARPVGEPGQEVGGTMITLMSLCSRLGLSVDACERDEAARVNAIDVDKLRDKQMQKVRAGMEA